MTTSKANQSAMTEMMDACFAHKIGDLVVTRNEYEATKAAYEVRKDTYGIRELRPTSICERRLVQCHGGVQPFYGVRGYTDAGATYHIFADHEVVPFSMAVELMVEAEATKAASPYLPFGTP